VTVSRERIRNRFGCWLDNPVRKVTLVTLSVALSCEIEARTERQRLMRLALSNKATYSAADTLRLTVSRSIYGPIRWHSLSASSEEKSMSNEFELAEFGNRAVKVRLIAQSIYDMKERLTIIEFVSEAEKIAADLIASKRQRL